MRGEERKTYKKNKCRYCKSTEKLTIDHKIPLSEGGADLPANFQTLCYRCNTIKSGMSHNRIKFLMRWFLTIQKERIERGANPYDLNH